MQRRFLQRPQRSTLGVTSNTASQKPHHSANAARRLQFTFDVRLLLAEDDIVDLLVRYAKCEERTSLATGAPLMGSKEVLECTICRCACKEGVLDFESRLTLSIGRRQMRRGKSRRRASSGAAGRFPPLRRRKRALSARMRAAKLAEQLAAKTRELNKAAQPNVSANENIATLRRALTEAHQREAATTARTSRSSAHRLASFSQYSMRC